MAMTVTEGAAAEAVAAPAAEPDIGWRARLRQWAEDAYLRPGSRAFGLVLDLTVFLVLVSLLALVLETVPDLEEQYGPLFFALEVVVVALFAADYAANIVMARNKLGYIFSVWGIIDVLAIAPFFVSLTNMMGLRAGSALRTLRMLRMLRVLKLLRRGTDESELPQAGAHSSFWRDLQFGLIVVCAAVALAQVLLHWKTEQLFWLVIGGAAAAHLVLRRWCLQQDHRAWAALLVFGGLFAGVYASWVIDGEGDPARAGIIAIGTVLYIGVSVFALEASAGAL